MSRVRTLTTEDERRRFENFLLSHSGAPSRASQCKRHRTIAEMTYPELATAMQKELGFAPTRQCVAKTCREMGVSRRRVPGPPPMAPEDRRAASNGRWARWYSRLSDKPQALTSYRERRRATSKRRMARLRLDPEAMETFLARRRVYLRKYRADLRAAEQA